MTPRIIIHPNTLPKSKFILEQEFICYYYTSFTTQDFFYESHFRPLLKNSHLIEIKFPEGMEEQFHSTKNLSFIAYSCTIINNLLMKKHRIGSIILGLPFDTQSDMLKWKLKYQ